MKAIIFFIIITCFFNCNNSKLTKEEIWLLSEMNKIFKKTQGNIVFISDNDCSECTKKYLTKASLKISNGKIQGLILRNSNVKNRDIDILKQETLHFINWSETNNHEIMIAISKITHSRRGVYIISFNTRNKIKVINLMS